MARRKTILFGALLVLAVSAGAMALEAFTPKPPAAQAAMAAFNAEAPGRGLDLYQRKVQDHAMAYALYGSAAALLGREHDAIKAADWLIQNPARAEATGWGLPFAWDAFGDGTPNPASTVYGVTTALAVRALFDTYDLTKDVRYRDTAKAALDYYRKFFTETHNGGYFWYSDQPQDNIDVHNISAILMGQYARAAKHFAQEPYADIAKKTRDHLIANRRAIGNSFYWPYSVKTDRPNDLVHASYIAQGFIDYQKYSDSDADSDGEVRYLLEFFGDQTIWEFPRHADIAPELLQRPARAWGVGMLIHTLADAGQTKLARKAAYALRAYEAAPNVFGTTPGRTEFVPRIQAHVALGLARLEQ